MQKWVLCHMRTTKAQHLYCSLLRWYDIYTCYIESFKILASFCSWAGWFESYLVENPGRHIFAWCASSLMYAVLIMVWVIRSWSLLSIYFTPHPGWQITATTRLERRFVAPAFQSWFAIEYSSCFISVMNLGLYVRCFDSLMSRGPSRGPNTVYVYKNRNRTSHTRRCFCCGLFLLSMFVRFLFVFDLLQFNLFRIAWWPSVGKELSPWLFTCAVFILVPS